MRFARLIERIIHPGFFNQRAFTQAYRATTGVMTRQNFVSDRKNGPGCADSSE
jgi:hypothetical protein